MGLHKCLEAAGYIVVNAPRNAVNHLNICVEVNGVPLRMIVDSGASSTLISTQAADRAGVAARAQAVGAGAGGADLSFGGAQARMQVGPLELSEQDLYIADLSHVNQGLERSGASGVDGVLGADVLVPAGAVLDLAGERIYLENPITK